jgi:hypothetical protein
MEEDTTSITKDSFRNICFVNKLNALGNFEQMFNGKYNRACIFGKGSTFKDTPKETGCLKIAVKDTINHIENADILVFNDHWFLDIVDPERLKSVWLICLPYHPHKDCKPHPKITWMDAYEMLIKRYDYKGHILIYNLPSINRNYKELLNVESSISSGNSAMELVCMYWSKYIKHIDFYGIGIRKVNGKTNGLNYNSTFHYHKKKATEKDVRRTSEWIEYICKKYKVNYQLH